MANKEAADRALKEPNPIIDGRKANVNLAILGAKPRGNVAGELWHLKDLDNILVNVLVIINVCWQSGGNIDIVFNMIIKGPTGH